MGVGESGCICVKPFVTSKGTYYAFSDWQGAGRENVREKAN